MELRVVAIRVCMGFRVVRVWEGVEDGDSFEGSLGISIGMGFFGGAVMMVLLHEKRLRDCMVRDGVWSLEIVGVCRVVFWFGGMVGGVGMFFFL